MATASQDSPSEIADLMGQLVRRARRGAAADLSRLSITPAQARVLEVIKRAGGPLRVNQLAGELGILPRSATSVVDDLERIALVERSPDRRDRRAVLVALTTEGRLVTQQLEAKGSGALATAIATLAASEQQALGGALRRIAIAIDLSDRT